MECLHLALPALWTFEGTRTQGVKSTAGCDIRVNKNRGWRAQISHMGVEGWISLSSSGPKSDSKHCPKWHWGTGWPHRADIRCTGAQYEPHSSRGGPTRQGHTRRHMRPPDCLPFLRPTVYIYRGWIPDMGFWFLSFQCRPHCGHTGTSCGQQKYMISRKDEKECRTVVPYSTKGIQPTNTRELSKDLGTLLIWWRQSSRRRKREKVWESTVPPRSVVVPSGLVVSPFLGFQKQWSVQVCHRLLPYMFEEFSEARECE